MIEPVYTDARQWLTHVLVHGEAQRGVAVDEVGWCDGETFAMRALAAVVVRASAEDGLTDAQVAELLTGVDEDDVAKAQTVLDHVRAETGC